MKKQMIGLLLLSGVFMCQPVLAMDTIPATVSVENEDTTVPYASDYIAEYMGELDHSGNTLELTSHLIALYTDKIEIKAQIQNYANGSWSNYGSVMKRTSTGTSVALDQDKTVPDGTYRVKYTFNAYVDDTVVETRSRTTGSIPVP